MIGPCPTTVAGYTLARDILASADCLIAARVEAGYAGLLAPGGSFATALTIGLTIYVAIIGYRLILGLSGLSLGEVVPHFIKIGVILALATSWPSYQRLVFDLLFHAPEQLASLIVAQAAGVGNGDIMLGVQAIFERLTDAAADAWAQVPMAVANAPVPTLVPGAPATAPVPPPALPVLPFALGAPQFIAALLWLSALIILAATVGVLLVVRIILALLLVVGPVFIAFALFRATRGLAEGWLRTVAKFALVPLFTLPLIAALVAIVLPLMAGLEESDFATVRDSPALLILLVVLVFAAVMIQAARLGGSIAGGLRLPRGEARMFEAPASTPRADPVAATSPQGRAETIVNAIDAGNRRIAIGSTAGAVAGVAAMRTITVAATPAPVIADNSARLGQGYRRLAIAPPPQRT